MLKFFDFIAEDISLEYHGDLNPKLWTNDRLNPDVRVHLLAIAAKWLEFVKMTNDQVIDIIITGGNCNYNYTDKSDIDLHIIADYKKIGFKADLGKEYFLTKQKYWAELHDITIKGYPVELYTQGTDQATHKDQGVYSLKSDKWIQKPKHLNPSFYEAPEFIEKVEIAKNMIHSAIENEVSLDIAKSVKDSFIVNRGPSVNVDGEFALDNLIFKELRNDGYIDSIDTYIRKLTDNILTLDEVTHYTNYVDWQKDAISQGHHITRQPGSRITVAHDEDGNPAGHYDMDSHGRIRGQLL